MARLLSPILRGGLLCAFVFGTTACSDGTSLGSRENGQGTLKPNDTTQHGTDQFNTEADTGTASAQGEAKKFDMQVVEFYAMKDDASKQLAVYSFCNKASDGAMQCVLYDDNTADAKMIGQETIIKKDKFETLSEEEKALFHPHNFEILSGMLVAPGMSDEQELQLMTEMMNTYGKTYLFESKDGMASGEPKLAWSITSEGEIKEELVKERDQKLGIDSKKKVEARQSLQAMDEGGQGAAGTAHSVMGGDVKGQSSMDQSQQQADDTQEPVKGDENVAAPVKGQEDTGDETAAPVKGQQGSGDETAAPVKGQQGSGDETAAPVKGQQGSVDETIAPVKGQHSAAPAQEPAQTQDTSDQASQVKGVKSAT